MFIRIVSGIAHHLPDRFKEWLMAVVAIQYGMNLSNEGTAWTNPEAWAYMLSWGLTENQWGSLFTLSGVLWVVALVVNGTFSGTWYSRVSPWVRVGMAAFGAVLWFMVYQSVSASQGSGKGIYQLPLILDVWLSLRVLYLMGRASTERPNPSGRYAGFS